jgi:hypothetical protein
MSRGVALLGQRATLVVARDPVAALAALALRVDGPPVDVTAPGPLEVLRFWLSADCAELLAAGRGSR